MNAVRMFVPWFSLTITITLLHLLWIGVLIVVFAAIANRCLARRSANSRYLLHFAVLVLMFLCVLATLAFVATAVRSDRTFAAIPVADAVEPDRAAPDLGDRLIVPEAESTTQTAYSTIVADTMTSAHNITPTNRSDGSAPRLNTGWIAGSYLVGVLLMLVRLFLGLAGGHRISRCARAVGDGQILQVVERRTKTLGLRFSPAVAYCEQVAVPAVVGVFQPVILLPISLATGMTREELANILTHELAHIRRCDHVAIVLQRLLEAVWFFHPAAWYISRRLSHERENCCDDLVVEAGVGRVSYAESLCRVAELTAGASNVVRPVMVAVDVRRRSRLHERIIRLLDGRADPAVRLTRSGVFGLTATLALLSLPALLLPAVDGQAETRPAAETEGKPLSPPTDTVAPKSGPSDGHAVGQDDHQLRPFTPEGSRCVFSTVGARKPVIADYQRGEGANEAKGRLFCFDQRYCRCQVRYVDLPDSALGLSLMEIAERYGFEPWSKEGKLKREKVVKVGPHEGEEYTVVERSPGNGKPIHYTRVRAFVATRRAFFVSASYRDAMKSDAEPKAKAFLESFRILGHSAGTTEVPRSRTETRWDPNGVATQDPKTAPDYYERGLKHKDAKRYEEALADYQKAGDLDPQFFDAHFTRSSLLAEMKDYRGAIVALTASLEARPQSYSALFNRGLYHEYIGEYDKAIADYTLALAEDADFSYHVDSPEECRAHAHHYRGRAFEWFKNDDAKAIADYTEALRLDPTIERVLQRRAQAYHRVREFAKAHDDFERLVEQDPDNMNLLTSWAWQLATCPDAKYRNGDLAVRLAKKTKHLDTLAAAYAETGNFDDAVATQKRAMDRLERLPEPKKQEAVERRKKRKAEMQTRLAAYETRRPYREK